MVKNHKGTFLPTFVGDFVFNVNDFFSQTTGNLSVQDQFITENDCFPDLTADLDDVVIALPVTGSDEGDQEISQFKKYLGVA